MFEKKSKSGAPDLDAKKDVLMALKKLAMQMMAEDPEGEEGAIVAKVQMGKLGSDEDQMHRGVEALKGPDMNKLGSDEESEEECEEDSEEDAPLAEKAAKKLLRR